MKLCPFHLLDREIIAFGEYERPLHQFYRRNITSGMTCLDVGANIGDSTLHLARLVGKHGSVHAFEPARVCRARLLEHVTANEFSWVEVHATALGDTNKACQIMDTQSSEENQGMGTIIGLDHRGGCLKSTVQMESLDSFSSIRDLSRVDFIKIDIQGAELQFLEGARATLKRYKPRLALEVSPEELSYAGANSRELLAKVEDLGYHVFALQSNGRLGDRIHASRVALDFWAPSVICTAAEAA